MQPAARPGLVLLGWVLVITGATLVLTKFLVETFGLP